jgi:hypothetical protein
MRASSTSSRSSRWLPPMMVEFSALKVGPKV